MKDWISYVCRFNWAKKEVAEKFFNREFKLIKIVWDKEGEYPEHAWGTIQWSVRPVWPGFGCDGTTDLAHHARACLILQRIGLNADELYSKAYKRQGTGWGPSSTLEIAKPGQDYLYDESAPVTDNDIQNMLFDLYDLNCRSYVDCITYALEKIGRQCPDYNNPSQPYSDFPEFTVPSSGQPLRVKTYKENGSYVYYISDGDTNLPLIKETAASRGQHFFQPIWWVNTEIEKKLEVVRSIKEKKEILRTQILCGNAPQKILDFVKNI